MAKETIKDGNIYLHKNANIHVDSDGNSYAVRDGKIIGNNGVSYNLPEVTVTTVQEKTPWKAAQLQKKRNRLWRDTYGMESTMETANAVTGGMFNQLQPTQFVRNVYNIVTQKPSWAQEFVFGNNGIISDEYVKNHPYITTATNLIGDILICNAGVRPNTSIKIKKSITPATNSPRTINNKQIKYIPDIQNLFEHNAFLEAQKGSPEIKKIIKKFKRNRSLKYLQDELQNLEPDKAEELNNFITTYKFQSKKIPYYTDIKQLVKDNPQFESFYKQGGLDDTYNAFIQSPEGSWAIISKNPSQRVHEAEHLLQSKRYYKDTKGPYNKLQEKLLNTAYVPQKNGIQEASEVIEKGAINQHLRANIIEKYRNEFGVYPTTEQLVTYIDNMKDRNLSQLLRNTNSYGLEYLKNQKLNFKNIKEALKYVGASIPITKKGEE